MIIKGFNRSPFTRGGKRRIETSLHESRDRKMEDFSNYHLFLSDHAANETMA